MQNKTAFATIAVFTTALFAATLATSLIVQSASGQLGPGEVCSPKSGACANLNFRNEGLTAHADAFSGGTGSGDTNVAHIASHNSGASNQLPICNEKPTVNKNGHLLCAG